MLAEHAAAVRVILTSVPMLATKTYDSLRLSEGDELARENYITLTPGIPRRIRERYTSRQRPASSARYRFDVRVVAVDAAGCVLLADAVQSVVGCTPTVAGRRCEPLTIPDSVEEGIVRFDREASLFYLDLTLETYSRPTR